MKVLIVDTSGKAGVAVGGAARVAGNLFYELRKRGMKSYYLGCSNPFIKEEKGTFIIGGGGVQAGARNITKAGMLRNMVETRAARMAYYSAYSIAGSDLGTAPSWVKTVKPDIVLCNSIQDYIALKKLKPYLGGAKLLYIEHANASGNYDGAFDYNIIGLTFGTGRYVGLEASRKRFFSFFDGVVALNMEQYRNVRKYNKNVTVIHSSVLMDTAKPSKAQVDKARASARIKSGDKVVLYFGRLLDAQKNVSTLMSAFEAIRSKGLKLVIVGHGRSAPLYEEMAKDDSRVRIILGRITDKELAAYYSLADLYVLPSIWESFNLTFIEAAHFGVGLLLSSKSINEDIVKRFGKRLYTFEPYDVDELKRKIEKYFADKALQRRLGSLSKEIAKEYTKKKQMDGYASALKHFHQRGRFAKA